MKTKDLSILIPARNEMFLKNTIENIFANIEGNTEVIAVLDGNWPINGLEDNDNLRLIYNCKSIGQRAATNQAARLSKAKYLMKCDAHCAFDKGFDIKMMREMHDDWTMAPLMKNLHAFDWVCPQGHRRYQGPSGPCLECGKETVRDILWKPKDRPKSVSYCFDSTPHFQYFGEYTKRPDYKGDITETMSLQGSCWMLTRDKYWELDVCDENFGSWGSQGIEVAVKTWLSGGKVMVNKKTWYAHMFRTQGGDFGFPYPISGKDQEKAKDYARDLFFNNNWDKQIHPLSWLVEKFWPVKGWSQEDLMKLKANKLKFRDSNLDIKPAQSEPLGDQLPTTGIIYQNGPSAKPPENGPTKGIIFYTDNQLKLKIAHRVQDQLKKISKEKNIPIVSASLKKMTFGDKNIHFPHLKRGYLAMFKQILGALENSKADIIFFCFQGNTHIETISGQKRIDKIKVGELVKTHLDRFRPVTKVFVTPYKQRSPIIQINTKFSSVRCTPEHPFYVYRDKEKQWIKAQFLKNGDLLLYPSKNKKDYVDFNISLRSSTKNGGYGKMDINVGKVEVDQELARFMGMYLAEGHFNGKNGIGFTFSNDEKEYQEFIEKVCYEKFNRKARKRIQWSTQILININQFGPLFKKWFGDNANNKKIPKFVFNWNIQHTLAFIKGFLDGDGSKSIKDDSYYCFSVASKKIVEDMVVLMNKSGIGWDNIIKQRQQTKFNSKEYFKNKKVYSINHSRIVFRKLKDILNSNWVDSKYIGIPIRNIKQTTMSAMPRFSPRNSVRNVYNLEVEEDNSYVAQSSIVHNCEHDVLYHPSHFDFTPPRKDIYYYNQNWWRVRTTDGFAVHWDANQVSGLCAYREHLLKFYRQRLLEVEKNGYKSKMGFEPGGRNSKLTQAWKSEYPDVDIKHGNNVSKNKWSLKDFRDKTTSKNFMTADEIPGWGKTKELIKGL